MPELETLKKFAKMFERYHETICDEGSTCVDEYDGIWHYYKDEVRPLIEKELK